MEEGKEITQRISEALKEFEKKSEANINGVQVSPIAYNEAPRMVRLVIKFSGGMIKDQKQAEYFLLGFVAMAIIVSFLLFSRNNKGSSPVDERLINSAMQLR